MNIQELAQWVTTGLTLMTFIGLIVVAIKIGHWTGVLETRLTQVENNAGRAHNRIDGILQSD